MTTEGPRQDQEPNAEQQPPGPPTAPLAKADDAENAGQQADGAQRRPGKQIATKVLGPLKPLVKWTFWERASIVGEVVFAAAVAWYAWVQSDVSKGQLNAMVDQNVEMLAQRKEMAIQTQVAIGQLDAMKGQSAEMIAQRMEMIRQGDLSAATIAQMRLEQRPWVRVLKATMEPISTDAATPQFKITFTNRGNTPAYVQSIFVDAAYVRDPVLDPENHERVIDSNEAEQWMAEQLTEFATEADTAAAFGDVITPDGESVVWVDGDSFTAENFAASRVGTGAFYCVGQVRYVDINGQPYVTTFGLFGNKGHAEQHGGPGLNTMR
jgi:lactam utilization protein B